MSTEIFPCDPLRAADVIDKPLEGFEWRKSQRDPEGERSRLLYRTANNTCVTVYVGNGWYSFDRGYRPDAVWFETFGMGIGSTANERVFFDELGDLLDCNFVSELGEEIGCEGENWDDDLHDAAVRAMQRSAGSTSRFFKKPDDREPGYDPDAAGKEETR